MNYEYINNNVALSLNHRSNGNSKMHNMCIVERYVTVKNIKKCYKKCFDNKFMSLGTIKPT